MSEVALKQFELQLPWEGTREQDEKFKYILKRTLLALLLFCLILPWLPIFDAQDEPEEKVVKTKILLKPQFIEPTKQRKVAKLKPELEQIKKTPAKKLGQEAAPNKVAQKSSVDNKKANKKSNANNVGVAAFKNQLSALRKSVNVNKFQNKNVARTGGNTQKSNPNTFNDNQITQTSGGLADKSISSSGANTQLASRTAAEVSGPVLAESYQAGGRDYGTGKSTGRDMESIRRTFEKHKGAINTIYVSALRKNPGLQGKFLFQILIEPDGTISEIQLISSELGSPSLENNLLQRFSTINFGPEDVDATPVRYTWNFLPS